MTAKKPPRYAMFGRALRDAMTSAGYTSKALCAEIGYTPARLTDARWGWRMPTLPLVAKLAAALDAPRLVDVHRESLTTTCASCERVFVRGARHRSTADGKRFCSLDCRRAGDNRRVKDRRDAERPARLDAMTRRRDFLERKVERVKAERDERQAAIDLMCRTCEPEGACRDATSPLREWSPLPLADERLRIPTQVAAFKVGLFKDGPLAGKELRVPSTEAFPAEFATEKYPQGKYIKDDGGPLYRWHPLLRVA